MFEVLLKASNEDKMRFITAVMRAGDAGKLLESGDQAAGIAAYREAIDICPACPTRGDYHVLLGCHFFAVGDAAAAEAEFTQALSNADGCTHPSEACRRRGFARAAQGRFEEALADMTQAAACGEDAAFIAQVMAIYHLALGQVAAAAAQVVDHPGFAECDLEARQRLALLRAEMAQLAGDPRGTATACDQVAALATVDGMSSELALWLAALDHVAGRQGTREVIDVAFAEQADWAEKAWPALLARSSAANLLPEMTELSWSECAENLAQYHRLAGLLAERAGDVTAARQHYETARIEPFTQWCVDYHLAGIGLQRLEQVA